MKTVPWIIVVMLLVSFPAWGGVGGGEITFRPDGAAPVLFSHENHVTKKKIRCSECHNAIFVPGVSQFTTSMNDMRKGRSCGACHNGERAFDVKANCQKCHRVQ